jgi:hypothetical protein
MMMMQMSMMMKILILAILVVSVVCQHASSSMSAREQQVFQAVADQCRHDVDYFCSTGSENAIPLGGWSLQDNIPMTVRWIRAPQDDEQTVVMQPDRRAEEEMVPSLEQHMDEMSRLIDSFFSQAFNDLNAFEELPWMMTPTTTSHHSVFMVLDNNSEDDSETGGRPAAIHQDVHAAEPAATVPDRLVQHIAEQSPPSLLQDVSRLMQERGNAILQQQQQQQEREQQASSSSSSSSASSSESLFLLQHPLLRRIEFEEPMIVRCARRLTEVTPEELARWHPEPHATPPAAPQDSVFLPFGSHNACLQRAHQLGAVSMPCGSAVQALERLRTRQVEEQASYRQEQHFVLMHLLAFYGLVLATMVIVGYQRHVRRQAIFHSQGEMQPQRGLKWRILRAVYSRPLIKAAIEHEIQQPMGRIPPVSWYGLQRMMNPSSPYNDTSLPQSRRLEARKVLSTLLFFWAIMLFVWTASPVMVLQVMVFISAVLFVGAALSCCCGGAARNWRVNDGEPMCTCCCCGATTSTPDDLMTEAMQCCSCCMGTGVCSVACANCCSGGGGGGGCCCCGGKGCCCCNGSCCGPNGLCCGKSAACCQGACCGTGCCCCVGGTNCGDHCCCMTTTTSKKVTLAVYEGVPVQIV